MNHAEIRTSLSDVEIAERVEDANAYDEFSVLSFRRAALHSDEWLADVDLTIVSADGSTYIGYVKDWDDTRYYVDLR